MLLLKSNCGKVVLAEKHRPENRPKEYWATLVPSPLFARQTVKLLYSGGNSPFL